MASKKTLEQRIEEGRIEAMEKRLTHERILHSNTLRALRALQKEQSEESDLREYLFGLTRDDPYPPKWIISPSSAKKSEHIPLLFASDFQWGEVIDPGRMDGVNRFNVEIAEERYRRLIERTLDISFNHLPNNTYKGIIYLRGGDMVSGDIHEDLTESNDLNAIAATRSVVAVERWGLSQLADRFKRVHVISVHGNHGRTTKKPRSKRGASDNYDTLSAWWLETIFEGDKRITFQVPESGDAHFNIYGRRYLATHGDKIGSRGGQGFIGPAATIMRGMKKTYDQQASQGMPFDKMFIGHFHVAYELDYGWSNGSLPGYSEFAKDGRMKPEEPVQWLIYFHKKYGATSRWRIRLNEAPTIRDSAAESPFEIE